MRPPISRLYHYSIWTKKRPPGRDISLIQGRRFIVILSNNSRNSRLKREDSTIDPNTSASSNSVTSSNSPQTLSIPLSDSNIHQSFISNLHHTNYNSTSLNRSSTNSIESYSDTDDDIISLNLTLKSDMTSNFDLNSEVELKIDQQEQQSYQQDNTSFSQQPVSPVDSQLDSPLTQQIEVNLIPHQTNLIDQYDEVLHQIIHDHLNLFQSHFASKSPEPLSPSSIIQIAASEINSNYLEIRNKRSKIKRSLCPASLYNNFLRNLYWIKDGGPPNPKYVFQAYKKLPYPPPRSINPVHLEDLITFFMGYAVENDPSMYLTILKDLSECHMPISIREQSVALTSLGKHLTNEKNRDDAQKLFDEQMDKLDLSNNSALNSLLSVALKSARSSDTIEKLLNESNNRSDRFTKLILLSYYGKRLNGTQVKSQYKSIIESGFIIDIAVLNLVMKYFLNCGYVEDAEVIFQKLLQQSTKLELSRKQYLTIQPKLRNKIIIMDYLLEVIRLKTNKNYNLNHKYSVPLLPDYNTFGNFFYYYSMTVGNFNKSIETLNLMVDQGFLPDKHNIIALYQAFTIHHNNMANEWTLQRLNYITQLVCHYETIQNRRNGEHFCTLNMARVALNTYKTLVPSLTEDFDRLEKTLNHQWARYRFYIVYKTLKTLSETAL